jgi:hypothetical protein
MSNESPLIVPLTRGWKPAQRVSQNADPILWKELESSEVTSDDRKRQSHSGESDKEQNRTACAVCQEHQSRYTCPRCQAPYCSVDCYRNHTATATATASVASASVASACTEGFYKNRVGSVLKLENVEQKGKTQQLLNRQYEASNDETLSDDLYELLLTLEEQEDDSLSQEQLLSMMSPALKDSFQRDLQDGKLNNLVLEPWHPWWKRELGSVDDNGPVSVLADDTNTTLDERLLRIPQLSFVRKDNSTPPQLLYNLIDILYSLCWTLRLYHGARNASHLSSEVSAAFVSNSFVLNKDARYNSLEQVLSECTASSTQQYPAGCNTRWTVLAEDCASILVSHRLVGRALFEASDLLKVAIQDLKKQATTSDDENTDTDTDTKATITRLRRIRKKLEFFLSWSQQQAMELGADSKGEILEWIRRWEHSGDETEREVVEELKFPMDNYPRNSAPTPTKQSTPPPLMVAVETKRKT